MRRLLGAALAAALLAAPWPATACGVCVEDKIAACYDHAVISRAHGRGDEVAFFAIVGPVVQDGETHAMVRNAIDAVPGVRRGTARVSLENAALSFAYDPRRAGVVAMADAVERRLSAKGLRLGLLKVMEPPRR